MKRILLIGDSIRIGYDKSVKKSLAGLCEVSFPEENCRFAAYVLRYLSEYKGEHEFDILHWNAGLWDSLRMFGEEPQTPKEVYAYYIERICVRIEKLFPNTKVIFATSTAVLSEKMSPDFKRYNEEIEEYNRIAVEIAEKHGFAINDLYAVSTALPEDAHSDPVHYYTSKGTRAFTERVLDALGYGDVPYREELYLKAPIGI